MQRGLVNTNYGSSAFIAVLANTLKVVSIRIYTLNNVAGEITEAAVCDAKSGNSFAFGVILTNYHHHFFRAGVLTSGHLETLTVYSNAVSDTSLIGFKLPGSGFNYFGYFSQVSGGDRQIVVNWRRSMGQDSTVLLLSKAGYDTYHTKEQITSGNAIWSGYIFQNKTDSSKVLM